MVCLLSGCVMSYSPFSVTVFRSGPWTAVTSTTGEHRSNVEKKGLRWMGLTQHL